MNQLIDSNLKNDVIIKIMFNFLGKGERKIKFLLLHHNKIMNIVISYFLYLNKVIVLIFKNKKFFSFFPLKTTGIYLLFADL